MSDWCTLITICSNFYLLISLPFQTTNQNMQPQSVTKESEVVLTPSTSREKVLILLNNSLLFILPRWQMKRRRRNEYPPSSRLCPRHPFAAPLTLLREATKAVESSFRIHWAHLRNPRTVLMTEQMNSLVISWRQPCVITPSVLDR